ncbi:3-phosphoserine/phosphohydroxythreonine transaminase [Bacillus sp. AFS017336]|uniref:3-phosphoserine/phosphohydroxythreonine transaminase n=1 Tax=Bacillus sp. AFS017336 TaxID=2033489 RepID=UPI000BEFA9B7|nr:3-phosphoserine/phosphohydroxythreonine transaminase [Bacillus sp. AFS017336]PEL09782.1 3-phosphoserine/phosphohydroxythreonine aminotransferase [Bacillus sp. AFS017336]
MERVFNFSAGPSVLPLPVLEKVQKELVSFGNSGMSVMEMSHRSAEFEGIIKNCENLLREVLEIPANYKVLFLQGGASTQFSMVPLNLLKKYKKAAFINTGSWSKKAISEAKKYGEVEVIGSSEDKNFSYIPNLEALDLNEPYDYVHITSNNTIEGTKYTTYPKTISPLVADFSSNILSEPIDVSKFGLIYAGAQKNIGPAGLTIVIIRDDLIGHADRLCPTMLDYKTHAEASSLYNTPPTFSIYVAMLVLEWIQESGGLNSIHQNNLLKAQLLYDFIDQSDLFSSPIEKESRSLMNIPFTSTTDELNKQFLAEANSAGFVNLEGHRSVGGMRASIYNAMPLEGVEKLVQFMSRFEKKIVEEILR